MPRLRSVVVAAVVFASTVAVGSGAVAAEACSGGDAGGEWASYGQNLWNARNQTAETQIGAGNVGDLSAAWTYAGPGLFDSTPVIADGCLFMLGTGGTISAVDADSGQTVWQHQEAGGLMYAPTVADGVVYVNVTAPLIPYVVALDESTGEMLWTTYLYESLLDGEPLAGISASSVVFNGLVFVPMTGSDLFDFSHPSFYILDAADGRRLKKTNVIPREDWLALYSGGGIWTTAVVDTEAKYLYVGTANPYNKRAEHAHTDSLMKIDVDPDRYTTFGEIVGNYKGENDYDPALYNSPQCRYLGELIVVGFSPVCGQKDIDFGASPNLFRTSDGTLVVGDLQKNCTYHAVNAATMKRVWAATELGVGGASGCASTSAYDDDAVYVTVNGGQMYAFDKDDGTQLWRTEFSDTGTRYQPVSVANGVVYTVGNNGHLYAFDASNGAVLADELMTGPGGETCTLTAGGGVAIARNTVYAACDGGSASQALVFAYKL
jgi:outer membrane protein assembly factor BamB